MSSSEIGGVGEATHDAGSAEPHEAGQVESGHVPTDVSEPRMAPDDFATDGVRNVATDVVADQRAATQGALPLNVRTGDEGVDAAVAQLVGLEDLPIADHAEVFTHVHRALQDALVDLDRE